ncbi:MAG: hypothetical protein OES24_02700 [Acidimicrobiia bacterium]|nr:hypothetical protein [Acidimicrobiia bacterium]
MVEISVAVPVDVAEVIDAAVDARVEQTLAAANSDPDPDAVPERSVAEWVAERGGWPAVRADAAIELLGGSAEPGQVELDIDLTITVPADGDPGEVDPTHTATMVTGARLPSG